MYLQSFIGIGTTNQKFFLKLPNVTRSFDHRFTCTAIEWLNWSLIASKTLQSIKTVYLQSFIGIGTSNQKFLLKLPHVSRSFDHSFTFTAIEWLNWSLIASKTLQSIETVYLQSFIGIGTSNQKLFSKIAQCPPKFLPQLHIYSQNVGLNG